LIKGKFNTIAMMDVNVDVEHSWVIPGFRMSEQGNNGL
jgi:hypothetical protein